jgi:hypothetical protein
VTFLIAGDNVSRVRTEVTQYFAASEHRSLLRLIRSVCHYLSALHRGLMTLLHIFRVVGLGPLVPLTDPVPHLFSLGSIAETYQQMYKDMLQALPITCAWTGDIHPAFPRPTAVIVDVRSISLSLPKRPSRITRKRDF